MYRNDTSEEAQKVYDLKIRGLSDEERFMRGLSLTRFCRDLCLSGIRDRQPNLSPVELKVALFESVYGASFSEEEKKKILQFFRSRP